MSTTPEQIMVAPSPTPFREDDRVDFAAIEHNVQRWLETPLSGFVLNSENGEEMFLSEQERLEIIGTVKRCHGGRKIIVAGIDCPSVTETLRLGEAYAKAGANYLRVRIPRLTANVRGYFEEIVPRAALPIIVIHQMAPGMFLSAGSSLGASAELIADVLAMDNVLGYITSDNLRFEARLRTLIPESKFYWISNGSLLLPGASIGANGGCMMFANVAPGECQDIIALVRTGKLAEAQTIQTRIVEADWQILSRGAAGIKAALNLLGFRTGKPRSPSLPCDDAAVQQIRQGLVRAKLLAG